MKSCLLLTALLCISSLTGFAQINMNSTNVPYVEDFNLGIVSNVKRASGTINSNSWVSISEPDNWAMQGEDNRYSLSSLYAAKSDTASPLAGAFTSDYNNNSATDNRLDLFGAVTVIDSTALAALGASNTAFMKPADTWSNSELTLRFTNNTGLTINTWNINLDTWWNDTGLASGAGNVFTILAGTSYDATGSGMVTVGSTTSPNNSSGWSSVNSLGSTVPLSIPSGSDLFVQLKYTQDGNGNAVAWDNLSVTPSVPEPASFALLFAISGLVVARMRSRKSSN